MTIGTSFSSNFMYLFRNLKASGMQSSLTGKVFFEVGVSRSLRVLGSQVMVGTLESGVFSVFWVGVDMIDYFIC